MIKRPAGGFPWEQPGFRFYTDAMRAWLRYEPTTWRAIAGTEEDRIQKLRESERRKSVATGWRAGSIPGGIGKNSVKLRRL